MVGGRGGQRISVLIWIDIQTFLTVKFDKTPFALKDPAAAAVPGFAATATTFGSMLMNISRDIFNR